MEEYNQDLDSILTAQDGRIIHQIWFRLSRKSKTLFKKFHKYQNSWMVKNPTWKYVLWSEKMALAFMKLKFPEYLDLYNSYPYAIQRIDVVRYFLLYEYGGLYADMDTECITPIDAFRKTFSKKLYLVETGNKAFNNHVSNLMMFSEPKHVFWKSLFLELALNAKQPWYFSKHLLIMYTTGPAFLNRVFLKFKFKYKINVFPQELFNPYCLGMDKINNFQVKEKAHVIHYGAGSWESGDSKVIIFFYCNWKIFVFVLITLLVPLLFGRQKKKNNFSPIK